ncbi:hypothetical protein FKM82_024651 [Ascaphus truei]
MNNKGQLIWPLTSKGQIIRLLIKVPKCASSNPLLSRHLKINQSAHIYDWLRGTLQGTKKTNIGLHTICLFRKRKH